MTSASFFFSPSVNSKPSRFGFAHVMRLRCALGFRSLSELDRLTLRCGLKGSGPGDRDGLRRFGPMLVLVTVRLPAKGSGSLVQFEPLTGTPRDLKWVIFQRPMMHPAPYGSEQRPKGVQPEGADRGTCTKAGWCAHCILGASIGGLGMRQNHASKGGVCPSISGVNRGLNQRHYVCYYFDGANLRDNHV